MDWIGLGKQQFNKSSVVELAKCPHKIAKHTLICRFPVFAACYVMQSYTFLFLSQVLLSYSHNYESC